MVRAKFQCQQIQESKYAGSSSTKIILTAVTVYNSPKDKPFWDATPAGTVELQTVNKKAVDYFTPGEKYFIDFRKESDEIPRPK